MISGHIARERESAYRCERLHANVKGRDEERERERERERETVSAFSLEINIYPKSKKRGQKDEIRDTYTGEREREGERKRVAHYILPSKGEGPASPPLRVRCPDREDQL